MKKNLFTTFVTEDYIDKAKQLFASLFIHGNWHGDIMLMAYNIPQEKLSWFKHNNILVKEIYLPISESEWKDKQPSNAIFTNILSGKLSLFSKEFKKWEKIIYMDSDIIIRGPINELAGTNYFSAVKDIYSPTLSSQLSRNFPLNPRQEDLINEMKKKYRLSATAFNAGVFSFDSKIIDSQTLSDIKNLFKNYGKLSTFGDQLILNLYFYKKWSQISLIYNVHVNHLISNFRINNEDFLGHVLHFPGDKKPWDKDSIFRNEWKDNLELSELNPIRVLKKTKEITTLTKFNKTFFLLKSFFFCNLTSFTKKTPFCKKGILWLTCSFINNLLNKLQFIKIKNPIWKTINRLNRIFFTIFCKIELKILENLIFLKTFLSGNILKNLHRFILDHIALIKFNLIKADNFSLNSKEKIKINPDFCFAYFTCIKDHPLLLKSLGTLELLISKNNRNASVFLYFDIHDFQNIEKNFNFNHFKSLDIKIKKTAYPMSWGGARLMINELTAFKEISDYLIKDTFIVKTDSDVLFSSFNIFKRVENSNEKLIGNKFTSFPMGTVRPFRFTQGGCYFINSSVIKKLFKLNIRKIIKETCKKTFSPVYLCPEDGAMFNLVSKIKKPLLLNFYLPEFKHENYNPDDLKDFSVIHLEKGKAKKDMLLNVINNCQV